MHVIQTVDPGTTAQLLQYSKEVEAELNDILTYWIKNTCDNLHGGFIGRVDEHNLPHHDAPKGSVMNSRILWAFSSAYLVTKNEEHLHIARVAYHYLVKYFLDKQHGGVYWLLNSDGTSFDSKKQIYALSFAIYGCSAYYSASGNEAAKATAIDLYHAIEQYSFDSDAKGYFEAFSGDWKSIDDLRLSAKDANEKKTMNTHLHVLEGYTALYRIWPDTWLKHQIGLLLDNFNDYFIDSKTFHLVLFFDEHWNRRGDTVSYGHDIEAAWLLLEAAECIADTAQIKRAKEHAVAIANAAVEGLDVDGGMWYEFEPSSNHLIKEKHSWVQAESMVGFLNAWQLTGDQAHLHRSLDAWKYVQQSIKDKVYGEWYWGRNGDGRIMAGQDKAGMWKCPYHNSRACIEVMQRVKSLEKSSSV